ncbi:MAG: hypothetical protein ACYC4F_06735, partial [Armatimonadota bacterium]
MDPAHIRMLELMSKGLTNTEIAVVMEVEPEEAMRLRRQMYLRLGVGNVQDALAAVGIEFAPDKSAKPDLMPGKHDRKKEEQSATAKIFQKAFGPKMTREGMIVPMVVADPFPAHLWVLHYPETDQFFFLTLFGKVVGLVSLSSHSLAGQFLEALQDYPEYAEG